MTPVSFRVMLLVESLLLGVVFLAASVPGTNFGLLSIGFVGCVAFGLVWLVLFFWLLSVDELDRRRQRMVTWLILPILGLIGVVVVANDLPLRARFELSRTAFEAAATVPSSASDSPHQVGFFGVVDVPDRPGTRFFLVPEGGLINEYGFAFRPAGPSEEDLTGCRPLGGSWWFCVLHDSSD